jgi:sensor histidine kinase YesM
MLNCYKGIIIIVVFFITIPQSVAQADRIQFDVLRTTVDTIQVYHFQNNQLDSLFFPASSFTKITPRDIYWIRINFKEQSFDTPTDSIVFLHMSAFNRTTLFTQKNQAITELHYGTFDVKDSREVLIPVNLNHLIEDTYVYIKGRRLINRVPISKLGIYTLDSKSNYYYQNFIPKSKEKQLITNYLFVGICLLIMFIATILYFIYKKTEYIYYTLNILCLMIYFGRNFSDLYISIFGSRTLTNYILTILFEVLIYVCYFQFIKYYLNTKEIYPRFHKSLNYMLVFLVVISLGMYYSLFTENYVANLVLLDIRIVVVTIYVLSSLFYLYYYLKTKTTYFVIIGSLSYFIGAILLYLFFDNKFFMYSIIVEIVIFGLGLGYKLKLEYNEKLTVQQEALDNYSSALRAQMNPHFIFNSLNSIQYLVFQKDTEKALKYITKFSRLMRGTMEDSINKSITLDEEIKLLKTYLEIESLRFDDAFSYTINLEDSTDPKEIEIPSFLIQPFVENAIIHGLHHKKTNDKKISISFKDFPDRLVCTIEDNGIGRQAAQTLQKHEVKKKNKSRALTLTQNRLKAMQKQTSFDNVIIIEDLYNEQKEPLGTRVTVTIPKN